MRALDNRTIDELGIPSAVLMENAGKGCADYLIKNHAEALSKAVLVLCGFGNNGGDGFVIARWLHYYKINVNILLVNRGDSSTETLSNLAICQKLDIPIYKLWEMSSESDLEINLKALLIQSDVVIDAIYGIGFRGKLSAPILKLIETVNSGASLKVAIDIPSGLNADTGYAEVCFEADQTLTMAAKKYGHYLGNGRKLCGNVSVIPIGIPSEYFDACKAGYEIDDTNVFLPSRGKYSHKGDNGRIAVFAGSPGFTGAAFLAATACLRAGAGLVTIFCHPDQMQYFNNKPYEVMVRELPVDNDGKLDQPALQESLTAYDVLLFGPGIGVTEESYHLLHYLLSFWDKLGVIDADGLSILAAHPELISLLKNKKIVLTPHWGEFCRLAKITRQDLEADCLLQLKKFVGSTDTKIYLKSHVSIYHDGHDLIINTAGNDGLAKGGSGDILSGLTAGFMGQDFPVHLAAPTAGWYLGKTAERLIQLKPSHALMPTEILDKIFSLPEKASS